MNVKQYKVNVSIELVISVDEDENTLDQVIQEMDYDFEVHPETDHAEIVDMEMTDYNIISEIDDTIKL